MKAMIKKEIYKLIQDSLASLGLPGTDFVVEHPSDLKMGDYSTNVGIKTGKAKELVEIISKNLPEGVERAEVAGPGFINFYLSKEFFQKSLSEIIEAGENFGKNEHLKGEKVMVEHTDPNPFKEFHIGHLMPNVIGSTIARIFEWNGAEVKQANYQGDVGLHVAKAIWGKMQDENLSWAEAYVSGSKNFEENKDEITALNKKIYDESDEEINALYQEGRRESLDYFDKIYEQLGTKFDFSFFESETAELGKQIVEENMGKVFEESDGAIVFKGEKFDPNLHTRVFINSQGIPTYEAKDLGNAKNKYEHYPYSLSVVVTGNEIREYFKVVLEAMKQIMPELAERTKHLPHGMLRLSTGKMSSRTGDVITAEALIEEVKGRTEGKEEVAIGAIKYMILRQSIGNDIVFDFEKSVSTEGDSGVYLQYAHARACSVLEKAGDNREEAPSVDPKDLSSLERLLYRFPEVVELASLEYAPNYIVTYLTELASSFNSFYAQNPIIGNPHRLTLTKAFQTVMKNGLTILGIPAPERV